MKTRTSIPTKPLASGADPASGPGSLQASRDRQGTAPRKPGPSWTVVLLFVSLSQGLLADGLLGQTIKNKDLFEKSLSAAHQALEYFGPIDDPAETLRVNDIGYAIAQASGFTDFPLTFHLINMPEPNAFALPGGQIFITQGMLDLGLDDDMLAGLLGHEVAHVVKSHGTRMERRALLLNILSQAAVASVIVAADRDRPTNSKHPYDLYGVGPDSNNSATLLQGTMAAGVIVSELLLRSYSRDFEDEADEEGQRWAAAAGFSPSGTEKLMAKMGSQLPQSGAYGYWQTHPFFDQRTRAAQVRRELLTQLEPKPDEALRQQTQKALIDFTEKADAELLELLNSQALAAWPRGEEADAIRLQRLEKQQAEVLEKPSLSRDFGQLIKAYEEAATQVSELSPESTLPGTLQAKIKEFEQEVDTLYPLASEVLEDGVFERSFLETFISNYPESPNLQQVRVSLGEAYARLGRQAEAVEQFLEAWDAAPDSDPGKKARRGLENLTPNLSQLGALQQLANRDGEETLQQAASQRLETIAKSYKDPKNGADYLERFPQGAHAQQIAKRQAVLADNLYGEVVLYQSVGENLKALERIQLILTYAPTSKAAERLRESMILDT